MRRSLAAAALVLLAAVLQTVIFPVAGPLPFARAQLAWVALLPLLLVIASRSVEPLEPNFRVSETTGDPQTALRNSPPRRALLRTLRHPILRATLWSYACGVLWYAGHCYWVFQTMHQYGNLSSPMAAIVLLLFCLYLGLYHALFGLAAAFLWRRLHGHVPPAALGLLLAALWVAVELARARVTSFPWDLLGYSQIDNTALTALAPFTGVYGLSFLVALVNACLAVFLFDSWHAATPSSTSDPTSRQSQQTLEAEPRAPQPARQQLSGHPSLVAAGIATVLTAASIVAGLTYRAPEPPATATALAVQPNLNPSEDTTNLPGQPRLEQQLSRLTTAALQTAAAPQPQLILWPEAPTPWELHEPALNRTLQTLAAAHSATVLADTNAVDPDAVRPRRYRLYNSAALFTAAGLHARYDKIHLVPFGEFVPFADLFHFASGLTEQVGTFDRGTRRLPLSDGAHQYGVFICYESIFPEEVRELPLHGAQVLVNLSDDGWYGDTSAPFQHSSMARMRAIENRRWLLRDTNTGITESIDPYGNVRAAATRHQRLATVLPFAFTAQQTFYTRHGDLFAWACTLLTVAAFLLTARAPTKIARPNLR